MALEQDGATLRLMGHCPVEEAEPLLDALRATPDATVDLTGAAWLHTAVLQVLMVAAPALRGRPDGLVAAACLAGLPAAVAE
ncbi:hypothetical protein SAMN05216360_105258 [Methylobacterium phyllostachyos]|uniref:STAS domain-containing protein n=1 Tax=Methylobacterium phyllostachyos TaxID=582672 RepID=A0A1G9YCM3_9HYPH|nr:hypothetical protein [Methylobacterium phyllostachyos]SDN06697.1 hypothetical protein SAMN05216360_105258 [Methylobacterium phyllostachyos]